MTLAAERRDDPMTQTSRPEILPTDTDPEDTLYVRHLIARARRDRCIVNTALRKRAKNLAAQDSYALAAIVEQARLNRGDTLQRAAEDSQNNQYVSHASYDEQYALIRQRAGSTPTDEPLTTGLPITDALEAYAEHFDSETGYGSPFIDIERVE